VMLTAIGWLLATGLAGRRDRSVAAAGALVAAESVVFVVNRGTCPLTPLAEQYGAVRGGVSDIFLPDGVARTIPIWATSAVVVAASLHLRSWRSERIATSLMRTATDAAHHAGSCYRPIPCRSRADSPSQASIPVQAGLVAKIPGTEQRRRGPRPSRHQRNAPGIAAEGVRNAS
jgi:hypothetical protein